MLTFEEIYRTYAYDFYFFKCIFENSIYIHPIYENQYIYNEDSAAIASIIIELWNLDFISFKR